MGQSGRRRVLLLDGGGPARAPRPADEEADEHGEPERRGEGGELPGDPGEGGLPEDPREQISQHRHRRQRSELSSSPPPEATNQFPRGQQKKNPR